eukprot:1074409-Prymnesium_polylepis.1
MLPRDKRRGRARVSRAVQIHYAFVQIHPHWTPAAPPRAMASGRRRQDSESLGSCRGSRGAAVSGVAGLARTFGGVGWMLG